MDATADGNEYPIGSRHHLLVFVRASSDEDAMAEALVALTDRNWRDGKLKEMGPLGVPPASIADPVLKEAALQAERGYRSIVVHDQA